MFRLIAPLSGMKTKNSNNKVKQKGTETYQWLVNRQMVSLGCWIVIWYCVHDCIQNEFFLVLYLGFMDMKLQSFHAYTHSISSFPFS